MQPFITLLLYFYATETDWYNLADPGSGEHIIHFGHWNMLQTTLVNSHNTQCDR